MGLQLRKNAFDVNNFVSLLVVGCHNHLTFDTLRLPSTCHSCHIFAESKTMAYRIPYY